MKFQISRQIQTGCAGAFVYDRGVPKTIFSVFEKGMTYMQTITQEYLLLFNAITDAEEALSALGELTGKTVREDVTNRIFQRFCVGK